MLRKADTPGPGSGEALVRLEYAGVNYTGVCHRNGMYAKFHTCANLPPFTLGREGGGVVERVRPDVDPGAPGDRVAWCIPLGSCADTIDSVFPLGDAAEAHRMLEARETRGEPLLKVC